MIVGCSTNSQSCWKWVDRDPPWKTDAQSRPTGTKGCHQFLLHDDGTDDIKPFVYIRDPKNIDFGGCVLECSKSRVLKVFTIFTKSGFGGQLYFWNNVAQGVEMWRKFKRWICVSCKVPACIFNYSFCANQSFIHRPVWSIWDTRQDCSVNPLSLSYRRSHLWDQGFSTSNFWLLKDQRIWESEHMSYLFQYIKHK